MNKTAVPSFAWFLVLMVAISCTKKGDDDPAVSFRSRENRISQEWNLVNGYYTYQIPDTYYTFKFSTSNVYFYLNGLEMGNDTFDQVLTIFESGNFTRKTGLGLKLYYDIGTWFFGGKNEQLATKNKETILLSVSSYTEDNQFFQSWTGINNNAVYYIKKLSYKELILHSDYSYYDDSLRTVLVSEYYQYLKKGEEEK